MPAPLLARSAVLWTKAIPAETSTTYIRPGYLKVQRNGAEVCPPPRATLLCPRHAQNCLRAHGRTRASSLLSARLGRRQR